ncbi:MAG: hypothetical protein ACE5H8_14700 [Alphaproteobacteria bacterium]
MVETLVFLAVLGAFALPLLHVALSPRGGPFVRAPGARCPFGPRTGWLVLVLLLGPLGWLLYMLRRRTISLPASLPTRSRAPGDDRLAPSNREDA